MSYITKDEKYRRNRDMYVQLENMMTLHFSTQILPLYPFKVVAKDVITVSTTSLQP